jgi:protein-tyrosine sulfotransferase
MAETRNEGIILLGLPRSGTTLLRRLLNWHPEVHCGGETFLLTAAARFLRSDRIVDGIDYGVLGGLQAAGVPRDAVLAELRGFVAGFFERLASGAGKPRWASKTAIDSFYVAEIESLFADHARFVCLLRDGLDAVLSLKDLCEANETYIRELHEYIVRYPRPLEAFAHAWSDVTGSLLDLAERRPASTLVVQYEELVRSPGPTLDRIVAFLGIAPGHALLEALERDAPSGLGDWKTYGKSGIDPASIGRARALPAASVSLLAPIVNAVLVRAGYAPVAEGAAPTPEQAMRRYEMSMSVQALRSREERKPGS